MLQCIIFDLDGVLVSTDEYHYQAWKDIADELHIPFNKDDNMHQRGVSRLESLEIILKKTDKIFTHSEKLQLANKKNTKYIESIEKNLTKDNILPGVLDLLYHLKTKNITMIVGSSSKNADFILTKTKLHTFMDAVVSGLDITNSKPHPEVFITAGQKSGYQAHECLVIEDADTGIDAALAAGMRVLAVGAAKDNKKATFNLESLIDFNLKTIATHFNEK